MDANQRVPELAFISMGSNIRPHRYLPQALAHLARLGGLLRVSNVYQNPAQGPLDQDDFLNAAALIETDQSARELRSALRAIELDLERRRGVVIPGLSEREAKCAPRTIDLDLSLLGQQIIRAQDLQLPDPDILTKVHVAIPLAELAPDFLHPETRESLRMIAQRLSGRSRMTLRPDVWREEEFGPRSSTGREGCGDLSDG